MPLPPLSKLARNIRLAETGLWVTPKVGEVSYPEDANEACFAVEERSFWFRHRNNCIVEAIRRFPPSGAVFDVGGGNGYVGRALQDEGLEVVLVEPGAQGARHAITRGLRHVIHGTLADAGFLPETVPAVGLFDVLEHIAADAEFLRGLRDILTPGGRLYLTVPAFQWLWSTEDRYAGHFRRYSTRTLKRLLEQTGYEVEYVTHIFGFLPLPIFLFRALPYRLGFTRDKMEGVAASDHELRNPAVRQAVEALLNRELSRIAAGSGCQFGGSCLAVARKNAAPPAATPVHT